MRCITLMQYLIEQERGKDWINADLRRLIEVVSRACKAISIAIGKGELAGKLRLMSEANPMAFIVEQAGGAATNGGERILGIQPTGLHERVAVILGSKNEVERAAGYHAL